VRQLYWRYIEYLYSFDFQWQVFSKGRSLIKILHCIYWNKHYNSVIWKVDSLGSGGKNIWLNDWRPASSISAIFRTSSEQYFSYIQGAQRAVFQLYSGRLASSISAIFGALSEQYFSYMQGAQRAVFQLYSGRLASSISAILRESSEQYFSYIEGV
jgi:hypothetical protein